MNLSVDFAPRLQAALELARKELLAARVPQGHWVGKLSSSALSTATAVCALSILRKNSGQAHDDCASLIARGLGWLASNPQPDGGWGDTVLSRSNLSTTALCWAAFGAVPGADDKYRTTLVGAESWLRQRVGGLNPGQLAPAIIDRYGKDRTFSVPILTMCALAGRLGGGRDAWRWVLPLPFELAAFPHRWFAALRLPVVSYALPALIAIGQARHHHRPTRNPLFRFIRNLSKRKTLALLTRIQPSSGGFLEATPLTSFVLMSLAGSGEADHPVALEGKRFLLRSVEPDGSWPIDTNLATWLTTLSINALAVGDPVADFEGELNTQRASLVSLVREWLLQQQFKTEHPYTHAAPGGWAWTDLPGGVPDADDTAGALLALHRLDPTSELVRGAGRAGVEWLLGLQNSDGGIPTFCRGWGNLPFDRSGPDLTAHAVRAWAAWLQELPVGAQGRVRLAITRGVRYLERSQRADGAWVPLWFGNQEAPSEENPTYGTSRVILALQKLPTSEFGNISGILARAVEWLLAAQSSDGGWGGFSQCASSVEETACAVEALAGCLKCVPREEWNPGVQRALDSGVRWLIERVESGRWKTPSPIGFYFAKLWYYEQLYPMIFTVGALKRAMAALSR